MSFFIIELYLSKGSRVFIIWGQNDFEDFFIVNKENRIYGFLSLECLKDFMYTNAVDTFPFNKDELINYKQLFSNEISSFSFLEVDEVLLRNTKIEEIGADDAGVLLNVYNLISDFFYQTNNEECLLLRKNTNMLMFFDYCFYNYFWKKGEGWEELQKDLPSFNYSEFVDIYKELLHVFVDKIEKVEM